MTLAELRTNARYWLDDDNGGYFTDAMMNVFLNNAQREAQKRLIQAGEDYYTKCVETDLVINQKDYALPDDFMLLLRFERITQGSGDTAATERLWPLTRNEIDVSSYTSQASATGLPYNYVINQNSFSLYPVPNGAKTVRLTYSYRVADMSNDADVPDVPADYHEYLAILAARDGFLRDGRSLNPIESKLFYFERMMDEAADRRNSDSPRMVVATPGGFGSF